MKYKVIHPFLDYQDNNYPYEVGMDYPREGKVVTEERIKMLSSDANNLKTPLIEKEEEKTNDDSRVASRNRKRIGNRTK